MLTIVVLDVRTIVLYVNSLFIIKIDEIFCLYDRYKNNDIYYYSNIKYVKIMGLGICLTKHLPLLNVSSLVHS